MRCLCDGSAEPELTRPLPRWWIGPRCWPVELQTLRRRWKGLLALAERRQFILDTAYAIALRRHRGKADPDLSVQLLEMANYTLQHRRRAGARAGLLLSSINLLIHSSAVLVVLGITVWAAGRAVEERDGLLLIAALVGAVVSARLAYNTWRLTLFPGYDRLDTGPPPPSGSVTTQAITIPQLVGDTLRTTQQLATLESDAVDRRTCPSRSRR